MTKEELIEEGWTEDASGDWHEKKESDFDIGMCIVVVVATICLTFICCFLIYSGFTMTLK